jgi:hypothetical protein
MKAKPYMVQVELWDMVMADSKEKAVKEFIENHKGLTKEDIDRITCEEFDKVMEDIKKKK